MTTLGLRYYYMAVYRSCLSLPRRHIIEGA